jgi:hypothetical protein
MLLRLRQSLAFPLLLTLGLALTAADAPLAAEKLEICAKRGYRVAAGRCRKIPVISSAPKANASSPWAPLGPIDSGTLNSEIGSSFEPGRMMTIWRHKSTGEIVATVNANSDAAKVFQGDLTGLGTPVPPTDDVEDPPGPGDMDVVIVETTPLPPPPKPGPGELVKDFDVSCNGPAGGRIWLWAHNAALTRAGYGIVCNSGFSKVVVGTPRPDGWFLITESTDAKAVAATSCRATMWLMGVQRAMTDMKPCKPK